MIASIGPFWDANETWLVLGIGLLLVAFPVAHGIILSALYLPVALMLIALIAARRRLRVPRQGGAGLEGDLGPQPSLRLAAHSAGAGLHARPLRDGLDRSLATVGFGAITAICVAGGPTR
jgi:cytochrome d ubiquinol oxidase subunit II